MNLQQRTEDIRNFFNEKIETYDEVHLKQMQAKREITNNLDNSTQKILDLGIGTGLELIPLFERFPNAKVTGIDITENMLEKLKERNFYNNITSICGNFFEVNFGANYDAVISSAALHHFIERDKRKLYQKIYDCLKIDGQFINSDRFLNSQKEQDEMYQYFLTNPDNKAHLDTPLYVENERKILEEIGFKDIGFQNTQLGDYKVLVCRKK